MTRERVVQLALACIEGKAITLDDLSAATTRCDMLAMRETDPENLKVWAWAAGVFIRAWDGLLCPVEGME